MQKYRRPHLAFCQDYCRAKQQTIVTDSASQITVLSFPASLTDTGSYIFIHSLTAAWTTCCATSEHSPKPVSDPLGPLTLRQFPLDYEQGANCYWQNNVLKKEKALRPLTFKFFGFQANKNIKNILIQRSKTGVGS